MISLVHPSRGRPEMAYNAYAEWLRKADEDFEYIISLDHSDITQSQYFIKGFPEGSIIISTNRSIVDAVNVATSCATGDIIVVMSDDFGCPDDWCSLIRERLDPDKMGLLHVNDTIQQGVVTLPILTRKLYERLGYVYFHRYFSMFADNDLTEAAKILGAYIPALDITFQHRHWVNGLNKRDATYNRENSDQAYQLGQKVFQQRQKQRFGL